MPNLKSSKKSVRTIEKETKGNTVYTSRVKNSIKNVDKAVKEKDSEKAKIELHTAIKNIDKCASKGLMKKNTSNRQKSRLNKKVKEM